jgi:hydroxymethylglutaryl-CoA lyase
VTDISIVEVGPRDGLQSSHAIVPLGARLAWIQRLVASGLKHIEVGAFVHPGKVPAMADTDELCTQLGPAPAGVVYRVLTPNVRGIERALAVNMRHVAVFTAASNDFTYHNIGMTIEQSLDTFAAMLAQYGKQLNSVRGYVSTVIRCPYGGTVDTNRVIDVTQALLEMGCYEVSLGETLGVAVPSDIHRLLLAMDAAHIPFNRLAIHVHDTYGMGVANVQQAVAMGIRVIDSSAGGIGGCPFAPGAAGNVSTEGVTYLLNQQGYHTGVDYANLCDTSQWFAQHQATPV